jgi:hypothetical protein
MAQECRQYWRMKGVGRSELDGLDSERVEEFAGLADTKQWETPTAGEWSRAESLSIPEAAKAQNCVRAARTTPMNPDAASFVPGVAYPIVSSMSTVVEPRAASLGGQASSLYVLRKVEGV